MPTLIAAFTLVGLLKMAHVEMPRWHLAFWFGVLVTLALNGSISRGQLALNGAGSFLAAWLFFALLHRTDNTLDRATHYLVLVVGFVVLLGSRLWLDIAVYGIGI
ncbi:MAG: response regulator [Burkholderiaceae bacterium]